jgi:hypothetical protein
VAWRSSKDPLLSSPLYRRNRALLKKRRLPCAVCGRAIDYSQPSAFVAGHIMPRWKAKQLGWLPEQINSLQNLRPECRRCSFRTGSREGNQVQRAMRQRPRRAGVLRDDSGRW